MRNEANQLRELLNKRIVLLDGAMGTLFVNRHPGTFEAEEVNESHPEWITEIHKEYIEAGADVIRTNTFALNHLLFSDELMVKKMISLAVEHAYKAVEESEKDVLVAASIGPIRQDVDRSDEQMIDEYKRIVDAFLEKGISIFVFETFAQMKQLEEVVSYLRERKEDAFILAEFSVSPAGYTKFGYSMQQVVLEFTEFGGVDALGFNCGVGAAHMGKNLSKVTFPKDCVLSTLPNAGYQQELRGRLRYSDDPAYYAEKMEWLVELGANIVGGCCGTTPAHIKALKKMITTKDAEQSLPRPKKIGEVKQGKTVIQEGNPFMDKLSKGEEKVFVVELDSPFGADFSRFEQASVALKEHGVDIVTVSDSPMARARADACMMALRMQERLDISVMPHIACRDRNLIGLRSLVLGAHINGIRNLLLITGDPVAKDDRGMIKGVFDVNSIRLMEYIKNMNQEVFKGQPIYYGGALNYSGVNTDAIVGRMKQKIEQGCSYFLTQPIYSPEDIERIKWLKTQVDTKILCGIMPLVSYKNALFMHNEMPGIHVSDEVLNRYREDMSREEAEAVAVDVCFEIAKELYDVADGFYIMTPFMRVGLVNQIIDRIRELG